ncbi:MAG: DUF3368 domain-containing protein [Chthoniobacteraceae bacterium]
MLAKLFVTVLAPPAVVAEFERLARDEPRFRGLRFPPFISVVAPGEIPPAIAHHDALDAGEIAALALAVGRGIRHVLIDETAARAAAIALGLQPSGLLGILIEAKKRKHISLVLPLLDLLRDGARFRVGDELRQRIATLAGESA